MNEKKYETTKNLFPEQRPHSFSGVPWVTRFGKLSIRENLVMTSQTTARPPVHTLHVSRCQMSQ